MRINPLLAFIWLVLIVFLSLLLYDLIPLAILLAVSTMPVAFVERRVWIYYMKYSLLSVAFIAIFNLLFLGFGAVEFTVAMVLKFLAITSSFAIFSALTDFEDMLDIAETLRMPGKAVASTAISMRFFPQVMRDAREIEESMMARGIRKEGKKLRERMKSRIPALSSLLVISLERSIQAAEALELKGFPSARRRAWRKIRLSKGEWAIAAVFAVDFSLALLAILIPLPHGEEIIAILPISLLAGVRR